MAARGGRFYQKNATYSSIFISPCLIQPTLRRISLTKSETVELRFEIKPEGNYANTLYTIRYFQYDGEGTLKLVDGPVLVNNDRVLLESKTFRLNYTANSSEAHKFLIVVEDSFNSTPWQQTFEFNSKDNGDDGGGKTPGIINPINPGTITPIGL